MQIELRELSSIRAYENNPRNNDKAVDAVAASIKEYGFSQPIVVDSQLEPKLCRIPILPKSSA